MDAVTFTRKAWEILTRPDAVCEDGRLLTHWVPDSDDGPGYWTSYEGEDFVCPACKGEGCENRAARERDEDDAFEALVNG